MVNRLRKIKMGQTYLIFAVSLIFALLYNIAFFKNVFFVYSFTQYWPQHISLFFMLLGVINIVLSIFVNRWTLKPFLILLFLLSSIATYVMNTFDLVINHEFIDNIFRTNVREASDLIGPMIIVYCLILGVFPALLLYFKIEVLHQMGDYGPAYFKRYPAQFEKFIPVCKNAELKLCTDEEIGNAYDNVILYTDYLLSKAIAFLKSNSRIFDTAMMYVSDHGESLGERGIYLHALPLFMAPKEQVNVAAIMWFGNGMKERKNDWVYLMLKHLFTIKISIFCSMLENDDRTMIS